MINFQNKPICPDANNVEKITKRMIKRALSHRSNPLKELINKQLRSKQFSEVTMDDITDFPKYKRKQLVKNIFLGTYQLKMSPSYAADIFLFGFKITNKFICNNNLVKQKLTSGSQIIAANLASRHRRAEIAAKESGKKLKVMYKVFILYEPNSNSTEAIQGLISFSF